MRRAFAIIALITAIVAVSLGLPQLAAAGAAARPDTSTVVVIIAPYLTWADIRPETTPALWRLAQDSALGSINARSRARTSEGEEVGSPLEGALSISSGSWAAYSPEAAAAYSVDESYEVGTAAEAFRRTTGDQVGDNRIVFLGLPVIQRFNEQRSYDLVLGTLGQAVEDAGGVTAAIGNSDVGYVTGEQRLARPAALAAMNENGLVDLGDVSRRMLTETSYAPFGIETDMQAVDAQLREVRAQTVGGQRPALIVLDPGDLYRVARFRSQVNDAVYAERRTHALKSLDEMARLAIGRFGDATFMMVGQANGDRFQQEDEGLGPILISGSSFQGYLSSDSTHRAGLVTNLDVTATILEVLGIQRPVQVLGNAMRTGAAPESLEDRVAYLDTLGRTAGAVDAAKPAVVNTFVFFTVVILLLSAIVLVRSYHWSQRSRRLAILGLKGALLFVLGIPVASWLMFAWLRWPTTPGTAAGALVVTSLLVWSVSLLVWWKSAERVPVAFLCLLTAAALMVDQFLGAPASFTNFFGYSPLLGARFYGMGNEAAAMLFGSAITGAALLFDQWPASRSVVVGKRAGIPLLAGLVIFTAAAPFLGANIGVALWGVVGFGLAWIIMNGHHVSWRAVFWIFLAVVVVIGSFAAIDLVGGEQQTHLARAIGSARQGGAGELWTIIARKAETNARVLTRTNWAYILIATLGFLGFMRWRPQGDFAATLIRNPDFADAITVSLVAGLVAYFTEDSGVVIPALEVFYVGVALSWLMLSRLSNEAAPAVDGEDDR